MSLFGTSHRSYCSSRSPWLALVSSSSSRRPVERAFRSRGGASRHADHLPRPLAESAPHPIMAIGHSERRTRADQSAVALHPPAAPAVRALPSRSRHRTRRVAADASRRNWGLLPRNRSPAFGTGAAHGGCRNAFFVQDHPRRLRRLVTTVGGDRGDAVLVR